MATKVLRVTDGGDPEVVNYPCKSLNIEPPNLADGIVFYLIVEGEKPSYDSNMQELTESYELTETASEDYSHLLIANKVYTAEYYSNSVIIAKLEKNLGQHLDSEYLPVTRDKHSRELQNLHGTLTDERKAYLLSLDEWLNENRKSCDDMITALENDGTYPTFDNWTTIPTE